MLLDMATSGFGDRVILGRRSDGVTAVQLARLAVGGAVLIREAHADALVYLDVNGPVFPAAMFAAARAGVPLVPLNYRLGDQQLTALARQHPRALVIAKPDSPVSFDELGMDVRTSAEWIAAAEAAGDDNAPPVDSDAPAVVIYTSGTTSEPKGVMLRHHNLVSYVVSSVEFGSAGPSDVSLVSIPPYHIAAVANVITNLYAGRRSIVLEQFSGQNWLALVRTEGVTHAVVVPTMLARIMSVQSDLSVPTLRSLAYGGAAMPKRVIVAALRA